jgi:RNA polymerase sigma factor (sigma-70 family)
MKFSDDAHFRYFASSLATCISQYGETGDRDHEYERQRQQVEGLILLERQFRDTLVAHRWGPGVYQDFVDFICDEKRNILAARPFFRERQGVFTRYISEVLKTRSHEGLYRFAVNYQFVLFAMKARRWNDNRIGTPIVRLAREIERVRRELIVLNMPLAISRARVFFSRTPTSHLTYMDLNQIAFEGLMAGIDKYSPEDGIFSKAFRSTAIGRMTGNFIEEYSETAIHFYPADKRKIYRANKAVGRFAGVVDFERLANQVNDGADRSHQTTPSEIADLMAASSTVSADTATRDDQDADPGERSQSLSDRFAAPDSWRPDIQYENDHDMELLADALAKLTVFETKLLRLKGLRPEDFRYMAC